MRQREEAALYQFRRADVTARGRRSQAAGRQAVVAREEAGLRLAEELSEDRLLVARETLELSVTRQAERQHVLERKKAAARTPGEREELTVLRRNEACLILGVPQSTKGELGAAFWHELPKLSGFVHVDSPRGQSNGPRLATTT